MVFSAHSLPTRTVEDGSLRCLRCHACEDACRYRDGLAETADRVAAELGLPRHEIAWQSAGRTDDPWWGPPIEEVLADLASQGCTAAVVCSAGFVADHLEILYDLDIEAKAIAEEAGMRSGPHRDAERRPRVRPRARRRRPRAARGSHAMRPSA